MDCFGDGVQSLKTFLTNAVSDSAFLVTCGVLSHAIFKNEQTYELFDSHGFVTKYDGRKIKPKGSIFRFSSLDELNKFVVGLHGEGTYIQVAQVTVKPQPAEKRLSKVFHEYRYEPYIDMTILPRDRIFLPSSMTPLPWRMKTVDTSPCLAREIEGNFRYMYIDKQICQHSNIDIPVRRVTLSSKAYEDSG